MFRPHPFYFWLMVKKLRRMVHLDLGTKIASSLFNLFLALEGERIEKKNVWIFSACWETHPLHARLFDTNHIQRCMIIFWKPPKGMMDFPDFFFLVMGGSWQCCKPVTAPRLHSRHFLQNCFFRKLWVYKMPKGHWEVLFRGYSRFGRTSRPQWKNNNGMFFEIITWTGLFSDSTPTSEEAVVSTDYRYKYLSKKVRVGTKQ